MTDRHLKRFIHHVQCRCVKVRFNRLKITLPTDSHDDKNPNDRYCKFHAEPKVKKVREQFADRAASQ